MRSPSRQGTRSGELSFIIFFLFAFLTTAYLPAENLSGWLSTVSTYNPVTYVLGGLRSLFTGWDAAELGKALLATSPSQRSPRRFRCSPSGVGRRRSACRARNQIRVDAQALRRLVPAS